MRKYNGDQEIDAAMFNARVLSFFLLSRSGQHIKQAGIVLMNLSSSAIIGNVQLLPDRLFLSRRVNAQLLKGVLSLQTRYWLLVVASGRGPDIKSIKYSACFFLLLPIFTV